MTQDPRAERTPPYAWVMLLLLSLPSFATDYAQFQLSAYAAAFMRDFGISTAQFSAVTLSFTVVTGIVGVVGGVLADRFGARRVVVLCGCVSGAAALLRLLARSYAPFFCASLFLGAFLGAIQATSGKIINAWFPVKRAGAAFAFYCAMGAAGISAAQLTVPLYSGYRQALLVSGLMLVLAVAPWLAFGRNAPAGAALPPSQPVFRSIGRVARRKNVWIAALCLACFTALIYSLSALLPTVLAEGFGLAGETANRVSSLLNIAAIVGSLVIPLAQARLGKYRPLLIALMLLTAAAVLPLRFAAPGWVLPLVCLAGFFLSTGAAFFMATLTGLPELDADCLGSATGLATLLQYIIGGFLLPSYGIAPFVERSYDLLFACAAALAVLQALGAALLPEVGKGGPKSTKER